MDKKFLTIKYKGKKHFVSYGDIVAGEIAVDKYRMFVFNTDYWYNYLSNCKISW